MILPHIRRKIKAKITFRIQRLKQYCIHLVHVYGIFQYGSFGSVRAERNYKCTFNPLVYNDLSCYWSNRKTAKSRKNAANSKPSAGSDGSTKPNHEVQPQCFNSESKTRRKKVGWSWQVSDFMTMRVDMISVHLFCFPHFIGWRKSLEPTTTL